jgi:hypothetical protein
MRAFACALVAASLTGCTLPPNVIKPNCKMTVGGIVPSAQGWVYCATAPADSGLQQFSVRDETGNAIVVTAPGTGSFSCGKPNLELELQFNGALDIAGCDPVATCTRTLGSCTVEISSFSVGAKQAFSADITAFAAAAPMSSSGYNITLSGSFSE